MFHCNYISTSQSGSVLSPLLLFFYSGRAVVSYHILGASDAIREPLLRAVHESPSLHSLMNELHAETILRPIRHRLRRFLPEGWLGR